MSGAVLDVSPHDAAVARVAVIAAQLRGALEEPARLRAERAAAFVEARRLGVSWRDLGRAAGISGERVQKIVQDAGDA